MSAPAQTVAAAPGTALAIEPLAEWPVPIWARGVLLDESTYCFADLKGTVGLLDIRGGSATPIAELSAPVSADLAAVEIDGNLQAVIATHAGEIVRTDREGRLRPLVAASSKVRAGLRPVRSLSGEVRIAAIDSRSRLTLIDPVAGQRAGLTVELAHRPASVEYGVVAAPLLFSEGGRNKLFLTGRSGVACQIDLGSGGVEWSALLPYGVDSDPVRDERSGRIFFTSGESLHGRTLGRLFCYDPRVLRIAWSMALEGGADVTPLLTEWRGRPVVVTATLMDASLYVFDRSDGTLLRRAEVPETPGCRHSGGRCIPVGYGVYHTQTAICKFYASPFALVSTTGETLALYAASHNGRLYRLEAQNGLLASQPLGGSVRASPARESADSLIVHAGTRILRLRAADGRRFVTSLDVEQGISLDCEDSRRLRFTPRRAALAARRLRDRISRRLLGRRTE